MDMPGPFYRPRPDPDKPALPYTRGRWLTVQRHVPPPPFGGSYANCYPPPPANLQQLTQLEYCLSNSLLEGSTGAETFLFTITKEIAVGDRRGPQIVAINDKLVAKIYDPLYYPPYDVEYTIRSNVLYSADHDYTHEAAAYDELSSTFGGTVIPAYYGSWTCEIAVNTPSGLKKRPVRLIVIELVNGIRMFDMDPKRMTDKERDNIMVKVVEGESALAHHGVNQGDLSPRNVICSGPDMAGDDLRVVIIDFNLSLVFRILEGRRPKDSSKLPVSPIKRHFGDLWDFVCGGWLPFDVDEWLWQHWGDSPFYQPVTRGKELGFTPPDLNELR